MEVVFQRLHEEKLAINLEKCDFFKQELVYLGFVVPKGSLKMDQEKVATILYWTPPTTSIEVRSFHGVAQFYIKFIKNFSSKCAHFLDTNKDGVKSNLKWTLEVEKSFEILKKQVATQHVLQLPSFEKLFTLECNASG